MQVVILRGLPGSGKSHMARTIEGAVVCSTDDYFVDEAGHYKWARDKIHEVHKQCFLKFLRTLQEGTAQVVIVDNTNLLAWEIAPYYQLAESLGHQVVIVTIEAPVELCKRRNVHQCPPEVIDRRYRAMVLEQLPPYWELIVHRSG